MPNTVCLFGPPFDIVGETYLPDNSFSFTVEFDSVPEQESVLAYQWFLDKVILIQEQGQQVSSKANDGPHSIGVRLLTAQGWSGIKYLDFYANIVPGSLIIQGPTQLEEGSSATYETYLSFGSNAPIRVTDKTNFSINLGGAFDFNQLTTYRDDTDFSDKYATITATLEGGMSKNLPLTILNTNIHYPSVLVIDLFNDTPLNAGALIINADVVGGQALVYTGNNFLPSNSASADAYILASDLVDNGSILKWRLEFNIAKLIRQYPRIKDFVLEVRGRSNTMKTLEGAFALKDYTGVMAMNGNVGNYVPTVIGGANVYYSNFQTYAAAGANGNYNKDYLPMLLRFNFNVPTSTLTYQTAEPIIIDNFDFAVVRYIWEEEEEEDLDILVGFEDTGTIYDDMYVGFASSESKHTVPVGVSPQSNSYLWWGGDNQGSGTEAVLISYKNFIRTLPLSSANIVDIGLYAGWYRTPKYGNFNLSLVTYKGGTMVKDGTDFINTGGTIVNSEQVSLNTEKVRQAGIISSYYKIGVVRYNKITKMVELVLE
ncbi:hypothetical protein [Pedobacter sp. UBA4863]|uniref:hypothetical protein n=1 Tax=Pedobacter sp. UBA4863 TaxID=1947060 RepID=UPI0026001D5E|nr:hypothetical protein [Pedobacter sp. UBA4863]